MFEIILDIREKIGQLKARDKAFQTLLHFVDDAKPNRICKAEGLSMFEKIYKVEFLLWGNDEGEKLIVENED